MASDRDELIEHYFNSGYNYAEIIFIYNYQIISLYSFAIKNRNLLELVTITSNEKKLRKHAIRGIGQFHFLSWDGRTSPGGN